MTITDVPLPDSLLTGLIISISPSKSSIMLKTKERPRPVPSPASLVVKKGSKIRSLIDWEIPTPWSVTVILTCSSCEVAFKVIVLFG